MFLNSNAKSILYGNFNQMCHAGTLLKYFIGMNLFSLVNAGVVCFEHDDHDHKLVTRAGLDIDTIVSVLKNKCGIYNDEKDDCARWFTVTVEYGKGVFGGTSCTLDYHVLGGGLDPCIDGNLKEQCPDGYGTGEDILATIGIAVAGIVVLCCVIGLLLKYRNSLAHRSSEVLIERSSIQQQLLSDESGQSFFKFTSGKKASIQQKQEDLIYDP